MSNLIVLIGILLIAWLIDSDKTLEFVFYLLAVVGIIAGVSLCIGLCLIAIALVVVMCVVSWPIAIVVLGVDWCLKKWCFIPTESSVPKDSPK